MKRSREEIIAYTIVLLCIAFFFGRSFFSSKPTKPTDSPIKISGQETSSISKNQSSSTTNPNEKTAATFKEIPSNHTENDPKLQHFKDVANLEIQLPDHLQYLPLDLEDGMESLHAYDLTTKVGLTLIAAPRTASEAEAQAFAKDISTSLPNFKNDPITQLEAPTVVPTNEKNGLKNATWWKGKTSLGNEVHIILMPRQDNKGTYMIIGGGPASYFAAQEENFDKFFSTAKALPRK